MEISDIKGLTIEQLKIAIFDAADELRKIQESEEIKFLNEKISKLQKFAVAARNEIDTRPISAS